MDISKSHLAKELKVILEEAARRLQEGGPGAHLLARGGLREARGSPGAQLLAMGNLGGQGVQGGAIRGLGMVKYKTGNVGSTEQSTITDVTEQSNMIASALEKVEHANSRDGGGIDYLPVDGQENILDGFMEGFNESGGEDSGAGGPGPGPSPWLLGALAGAVVGALAGALVWAGGAWGAQGRR